MGNPVVKFDERGRLVGGVEYCHPVTQKSLTPTESYAFEMLLAHCRADDVFKHLDFYGFGVSPIYPILDDAETGDQIEFQCWALPVKGRGGYYEYVYVALGLCCCNNRFRVIGYSKPRKNCPEVLSDWMYDPDQWFFWKR